MVNQFVCHLSVCYILQVFQHHHHQRKRLSLCRCILRLYHLSVLSAVSYFPEIFRITVIAMRVLIQVCFRPQLFFKCKLYIFLHFDFVFFTFFFYSFIYLFHSLFPLSLAFYPSKQVTTPFFTQCS